MSSFRNKIRHLALVLIAVLLASFSILVYWGFESLLHQYVDTRLLAVAESLAEIIENNPQVLLEPGKEIESRVHQAVPEEDRGELREAAMSIELLALDGAVLWKGAAAGAGPPVAAQLLDKARQGKAVYDTVSPPKSPRMRRVAVPVRHQGEVRYILQAQTSLRMMQEALRALIALLAVASALTLVLAWFGSGWLADRALTPVELLSATAQRISDPSQNARLSLDAPYEEFQRLARAFNAMMDRLQRAFEGQRRFTADAAHELQTPLTALKGNLEVAFQQARTASEYREVLIDNLEEVERLIGLSRSLVALAQLDGPTPPEYLRAIALAPLLRDLVTNLTVLAEDRKLSIALEAPDALLRVRGDEGQLKRLFINLLDNAIRYTGPGGAITIRLAQENGYIAVAVEDTGEGIAPEHLPHIFERFYRADQARARNTGGTGLGLAIVKEIVEAHHGSIEVKSDAGKGSTFIIRLPALHTQARQKQKVVGDYA
jgi:heavy metal sensor kinase